MNLSIKAIRRPLGAGVSALLLLLAQQALAVGTAANTTITNQAQVDYQVGGVDQEFILSDPGGNSIPGAASGALSTDFVVDNRVDFTLAESGNLAHTPVTPGQLDQFVQFELTNTGNATQDFRLVAGNFAGDVDGLSDTVDMINFEIFVDGNGNDTLDAADVNGFVDELPADTSVTIFVVADAQTSFANGDVANVQLQAIVADAGGAGLGADTNDDAGIADDVMTVQVVFGDDGAGSVGDGQETAEDGYQVSSAVLSVTKSSTLIDDPFNGTTNPKHIPGATVEYVIEVVNTGTEDATNVVVTDALTNLTPAASATIDNDGTTVGCTTSDADSDLCAFTAGTLTVGLAAPAAGIDLAAGTTLTVTFRVTID